MSRTAVCVISDFTFMRCCNLSLPLSLFVSGQGVVFRVDCLNYLACQKVLRVQDMLIKNVCLLKVKVDEIMNQQS